MVGYYAPECAHNNVRDTCRFFTFPPDSKTLRKWMKLIRREDREPSKHSRICSCHFLDGKKENGPTIFPRNVNKRLTFSSPEKRKYNRRLNELALAEPTEQKEEPQVAPPLAILEQPSEEEHPMAYPEDEPLLATPGPSTSQAPPGRKLAEKVECSYEAILHNEGALTFYTGLANAVVAKIFFSLFDNIDVNYYYGWTVLKISRQDQILMTLMKLRLNLKRRDLCYRFGCSEGTVSNIIITWIHVFHSIIFENLMDIVPSQEKNKCCLPGCFKDFPNCRMVLDCTEIFCDIPHDMNVQKSTFSHYKHHNTLKGLVGIAPNGVVTYCSPLYPGSISDQEIVRLSGVLNIFEPGDLVLADKGFLIADLLPPGVSLNIPPFLTTPQFTPSQVYKTAIIARARIHIERAINRIKNYRMLQRIPHYLFPFASRVFQVAAALTNFQNPLIREVAGKYGVGQDRT